MPFVAVENPPPPAGAPDLRAFVQRNKGAMPTVYVAADGGSLELWSRRLPDGRVAFSQAVDGQRPGLPLGEESGSVTRGFPFVRVVIRRAGGAVVSDRTIRMVELYPQPYDALVARQSSQFPCCGYPFSAALVQGIPQGYAVDVSSSAPLRRGGYIMTVQVDPEGKLRDSNAANNRLRIQFRLTKQAFSPIKAVAPAAATRNATPAPETVGDINALPVFTGAEDVDLPNLTAMPAEGISTSSSGARDYLNFGSNIANVGAGDIVVTGMRDPALPENQMAATQALTKTGIPVARRPSGLLEYSPLDGHNHWHYDRLAVYRILDTAGRVLRQSGKIGFCFVATTAIDHSIPSAPWNPWLSGGSSATCGLPFSPAAMMVLPAGWGDEYSQSVAGQAFNITRLKNGRYTIEIVANEDGRLLESTTLDNRSARPIILGGKRGARTVRVPPFEGVDSEGVLPQKIRNASR